MIVVYTIATRSYMAKAWLNSGLKGLLDETAYLAKIQDPVAQITTKEKLEAAYGENKVATS